MITSQGTALSTQPWKELYQAAISESDASKLSERLSDAETALVARARELFYTCGDDGEEGESLDYAMCILHTLRESLDRRDSTRDVSRQVALTVIPKSKWQTA